MTYFCYLCELHEFDLNRPILIFTQKWNGFCIAIQFGHLQGYFLLSGNKRVQLVWKGKGGENAWNTQKPCDVLAFGCSPYSSLVLTTWELGQTNTCWQKVEVANQSASFVVMNIHQHPCQSVRMSRVVFLALSYVDEALSEPIAVVGVVPAAAPYPVLVAAATSLAHHGGDGGRLRTATTAACRQLSVTTRSTDGVYNSCCRHRVHQSCFTASYVQTKSII